MEELELFKRFGVAVGAGIIVGIERGWHSRDEAEGQRVAGVRTFAIAGLLGGLWAYLADLLGQIVLGFAFLAFAAIMIFARMRRSLAVGDYGVTTVVASLVTFAIGAIAIRGELSIAAAASVITAMLLGIKPMLHRWIEKIERRELMAVLELLVMTLVLMPVLPDKGFGPWEALNPREIWWMVVLIAGMHLVGYIAVRLLGSRHGIPMAGLAGGLVASTAVAVSFSRLGREAPRAARAYAAGIVLASATMFARVAIVVAVLKPALLVYLLPPMLAATVAGLIAALLLWRGVKSGSAAGPDIKPRNPFEFGTALKFGALLAVVMLASQGLKEWLGETGILIAGLVSGLADVDAITLSLTRLAGTDVPLAIAAAGIAIAAGANTIVKSGIAFVAGGRRMGLLVGTGLGAATIAGVAGLLIGSLTVDWLPKVGD